MSEEKIEAEPREGDAQEAEVTLDRWVSKIYLPLASGRSLECTNGELFLPASGVGVTGRHSHPADHAVTFSLHEDTTPPSVFIRAADGSTQMLQGVKKVINGQEVYVGRFKGSPLGADCATIAGELGALAQDEGTWVATKGG